MVVVHGLLIAVASLVAEFRHTGSVVALHGLSYSETCGIFLDQESNLHPLHWKVDSYSLDYQGSPHPCFAL